MWSAPRRRWLIVFVGIVAAGLLSRAGRTGWVLVDKYLGDALYAAMVYALLKVAGCGRPAWAWAAVLMAAIEAFQLTLIPARMVESGALILRVLGRLLGTAFSWLDLVAYGVGIGAIWVGELVALEWRRR